MVDVVIPIYKPEIDEDDWTALYQGFTVLIDYDITFVHPKSLDIKAYKVFPKARFKAFDDEYFQGIAGYNRLMLSVDFYKSFSKKYILIYQTDAYVFRDELGYWCEKDYDYIGAPWIRSRERNPLVKRRWDGFLCGIKQIFNYGGNGKTQKNKSLLYNEVGNGGFSLRKREKFIEILEKLSPKREVYLRNAQNRFYAEDVFFSIEPKRNDIPFSKPFYKEACRFSIENKVEKALMYNGGVLPFGCHRWNKENRDFWLGYIK